jgi:sulfite reductase alpha subunit-like flavoprotein
LQNAGGMSGERATEYLSELKSARRYQRDVY